jgi:DNA-cytosine methyltransferase
MNNNKVLIKTNEAAEILGKSEATVKRWSLENKLTNFRGDNNHRYFCKEEVLGIRQSLNNTLSNSKHTIPITQAINPKSHPAHYLMHKYWGRKPHNVVSEYIEAHTNKGDKILDPFMGSGVAIIEAAKLGRKAVGVDLNPMSKFIVDNTINRVNIPEFQILFNELYEKVYAKYCHLYNSSCPKCQSDVEFSSLVWGEGEIKTLRLNCETCGKSIKHAGKADHDLYLHATKLFKTSMKEGSFPVDKVLQYVKRSGNERIDELFSKRALIILTTFVEEIKKVENTSIRDLLLFVFSSALPNCSRMLPGDVKTASYKSGWVISKFWVPKVHTERNVFECLQLRFKAILKGKGETARIDPSLVTTFTQDSSQLDMIQDESIDYIFTDPPYGESIAYLGLSHLWNSWLGFVPEYNKEIIIDSFRNLRINDFEMGMNRVFKELNRVLKHGKYISFTFHNRDLKVWKAVVEPLLRNGFQLVNVVMQPQAVSSGTQGINKNNTLKGDFIYNFMKVAKPVDTEFKYHEDAYNLISELAYDFIQKQGKSNSSDLYEFLIPQIISHHAFIDHEGKVIDVESLLNKKFTYSEDEGEFFWQNKINVQSDKLGVLDLFAGAGGFSIGLQKAGLQIVSAVEYDSEIAATYSKNHSKTVLHNVDIRQLTTAVVEKDFEDAGIRCDVIIGGPPCQGFSMSGNRIRKSFEGKFDERNELFMEFFRFVKDLKPTYFVFENVEGILNYDDGKVKQEIYTLFQNLGYRVDSQVLLASCYGVPQLRKRAFFFGTILDIEPSLLIPAATHDKDNYVSVWDAISDLPSIESGEGADLLVKTKHENYSEYQKRLGAHQHNVIYNHKASVHSATTIEKLRMINNGKKQTDLPEHMQTKSVHSGSWGRMEKFKPAYTITTRINTPSVGRIAHPDNDRTITPREAARIQSFPDDFVFIGGITTVGMQIGNAVSPLLAEAIGKQLILTNETTKNLK